VDELEAKASEFNTVLQRTAEGDLTSRLDPESRSEAMQEIARGFNRTIDELESTLVDIVEMVSEADTGVQSINEATNQQAESTQEVVTTVEEVASISEETTAERRTSTQPRPSRSNP
jgi:methyl-accepting chemotaxis protein